MFDTLHAKLAKYGQEHLLTFWGELNDAERQQLRQDIDEIDLDEVQTYFRRATASLQENGEKLDDRLRPIEESQFMSVARATPEQLREYRSEGLRQISLGRVGVLLMAGGQGTRLGFAHPKGMYNVGLPSGKSLFQIQAERIRTLQRLAFEATGRRGRIVWYIMTSEHTQDPTRDFLASHDFFGLNERDVVFFEQGSLPCFNFDGGLMLDEKHRVSKAPDGNGGLYRALRDQGILDDFRQRGVEYLHAHSVDNILTKVADPVFIGYCVLQSADCAAKVVEKSSPGEAVGVVCMVDGRYQVVEYSEITSKTAELRNPDGRLTFSAGNICNHYFSANFLRQIGAEFEKQLKLHVAKKKIPFVDLSSGARVKPDTLNGIKIEKFVFDVFEFAEKFVTVEVLREAEFSALKNSNEAGKDCPATAKSDIFRLHRKYVEAAGGVIHGVEVEISPLLSYEGEGLEELVNGKTFAAPLLLSAPGEAGNAMAKVRNGSNGTATCNL